MPPRRLVQPASEVGRRTANHARAQRAAAQESGSNAASSSMQVSSQTQPGATRPTTQASEVISDADLSDSSLSTLGDGGDIPTITEAARAIELCGFFFAYGLDYITDIGTLAATVAPAISDTVDLSHPTQNVPALLQEASLITQELAEFEEAFVDYSGQAGELVCIDPCPPMQILGSLDLSPQLEVQNASDPCGGLVQADQVVLDVEGM